MKTLSPFAFSRIENASRPLLREARQAKFSGHIRCAARRDFVSTTRTAASRMHGPFLAERHDSRIRHAQSKSHASRHAPQGSLADAPGPAEVETGRMMRHLCEIGDFVRRIRIQTRFGELSRARLKLLRFEVRGSEAECNLLARPADPWDAGLPARIADRNVSVQALKDAMSVRALLFRILPDLSKAALRVYRLSGESLELVITGVVRRDEQAPSTVRSLAMRAKLCGLQFWLDDGILESLHPEECLVGA